MPLHPDESFGSPHNDRAPAKPRHRSKGDINPLSEHDVTRLREAMQWSETKLRPFRERHIDAVNQFAGSRYGENHAGLDKTAINLTHLAVEVWLRQLAAQTPRSLVLTRIPELKVSAFELEVATDYLLQEILFGENLSEVVRSAIFSMGVMKVGITDPYLSPDSGFSSAVGHPYAEPVLFEHWIHDMKAKRREEWDWCGNKYKVPYELVKENPEFDKQVRDMIRPKGQGDSNDSLPDGTGSTSDLSQGESLQIEEYREHVELWDLWIPSQNLMVTLPCQAGLRPLSVKEWEGPHRGPYHILGFSNVPGNIIPAAPAQNVYELQDIITRMFNQLGRQALRSKTLTIADGRAVEDGTAERIMDGEDGQVIRTGHIDGIKEMKYGGADPANQAYLVWLREIFSYIGGNIDAMGGLAQQAGTLGQEQLLFSSSSEMIRDMQTKVVTFTRNVQKDLAWYMYTDPTLTLSLSKKIEDFGEIPFEWSPSKRKQKFFNYNFDIQPYSLQSKGPQQRLQTIIQLATQILLPLAPQMQEWGMQFNLQKFVELIGKYGDLPEVNDLVTSSTPTPSEDLFYAQQTSANGGGAAGKPVKPPVTQRNYTRQNIPTGGTQASRATEMIGKLMSAAKSGGGGK